MGEDYSQRLAFYRQPQFSCRFSGKCGFSFENAMDHGSKTKAAVFAQIPAEIMPFVLRQIQGSRLKMSDLVNAICENPKVATTKRMIRCAIRMFGQQRDKKQRCEEEKARRMDSFWSEIEKIGILNADYAQRHGLNEANVANLAFFDFYSYFGDEADHRRMNDLFCRIWRLWSFFVVFCAKVRLSPFPISFFLDALMTEERCTLFDELQRCLLQIIGECPKEKSKYFRLDSLRSYLDKQSFECDKLQSLRAYTSLSFEQKLRILDILFEGAIKSDAFRAMMAAQIEENKQNKAKIKAMEDERAAFVKNEKMKLKMLRNEEKNKNLVKEQRKLFDAACKAKKYENARRKLEILRESRLYFMELGADKMGNRYFWSEHGDGRIFILHRNASYHGIENDDFCWSVVSKLSHFYDLLSILDEGELRQNLHVLKGDIIESMSALQKEEENNEETDGLRRSKRAKQREATKDFSTYKNRLK